MFDDIVQFAKDRPVHFVIAITIIVIIIIMIGHVYRDKIQNKLKTEIYTFPSFTADWWSVSHFVLYAVYGLVIPNYHITFLLIGMGWELAEDYLASDKNTQAVDCTKKQGHWWCNGIQDGYWYGKWDDVIFNLLGYTIGSGIRTMYD